MRLQVFADLFALVASMLVFGLGNVEAQTRREGALVYDVATAKSQREVLDQEGRTAQRTYTLADGTVISVIYRWEGGSNRCIAAEARLAGRLLAKATVVSVLGDRQGGFYQEVEEIHYAADGGGRTVYRARSKFPIASLTKEKTGEVAVEGTKLYEVFRHWGSVR